MKLLLLGSTGQLGSEIMTACPPNWRIDAPTRRDLDFLDPLSVRQRIEECRPHWCVNCVAKTNTESCELDPQRAFEINAGLPFVVGAIFGKYRIPLVQISTDYVFGGRFDGKGWREDEPPSPLNVYGSTKLLGEYAAQAGNKETRIVRVSGLFGPKGSRQKPDGNFLLSILRKAQSAEPIRVVDDIFVSPTFTRDAAEAIWSLILDKAAPGIYHLVNSGAGSWYDFAKEILESATGSRTQLIPIHAADSQSKLRRSNSTVLINTRRPPLRSWQEALRDCLAALPDAKP